MRTVSMDSPLNGVPRRSRTVLSDAVGKYAELDENYDSRFGYYVKAIKDMASTNLNACLSWTNNGPCNQYFTCTYHEDGLDKGIGTCPLSDYEVTQDRSFSITYELDDEDGFHKTLQEDLRINPEWVELRGIAARDECNGVGPPAGSNPRPEDIDELYRR